MSIVRVVSIPTWGQARKSTYNLVIYSAGVEKKVKSKIRMKSTPFWREVNETLAYYCKYKHSDQIWWIPVENSDPSDHMQRSWAKIRDSKLTLKIKNRHVG